MKALTGTQFKAADVDGDGKLTVTDIAMIASHIKGIKALK
ncbi:MAG: hypothetical protein IIZ09_07585 [Ruminococcus sp.]|nr:hypothetical protein [Ruminococcus sp.]